MKIKKNNKYKKVLIDNKEYVIPVEWNIKNLKSLSQKIGDGLHGSPKYSTVETRFYFINGNNLKKGGVFINDATKMINEEEYKKYKKDISENTILLSINGTVGNVSLLQEQDINFILSKSVAYINPSEQINKHYLFYVLKSFIFKKYIDLTSTGSTIKNLSLTSIRDFNLSFPNLNEQENIVNVLLKQESIISNIEKLISKTEKIFEYFCDREFNLGDIEKNNYKIKDIIIKNPKSTIKAGDIKASTGNIPAFNSSAKLQYFYDDYLVDGENIFLPTGGSASIHYHNGKSCYTTDVFSFKTEEEKVINKYMYYYFKNDLSLLNNMFYGAGLKHLNKNELLNYKIFIPNMKKQKETVELLEKQERLIENQKKLLEKEKQKFEWLSEKLLSGEYLVVEEQE